jgi:NTE family protein
MANRKKTALVLGGGGLIGMAYHAGTLQALHERGLGVEGTDLIVGTSAGSIVGAYLAAGWKQTDFYEYAHRRHPDSDKDPLDDRDVVRDLFQPLWTNRGERARRYIGSAFALAASRGILNRALRGRVPGSILRRQFPSGMYSTEATRLRLEEELPAEWPERDLYICAADLYSGERVAFGAPGAPEARLPAAVLASTAIPGVFPPVSVTGKRYVDGGAYSASSLDLAVDAGCRQILCIAPLGYRKGEAATLQEPKMWLPMVARTLFARALAREVRYAREQGVDVIVFRPWAQDLHVFGTNAMREFDREPVVETAREGAHRLLDEHGDNRALDGFRKKPNGLLKRAAGSLL